MSATTLVGKSYETPTGLKFTVLDEKWFPAAKIGAAHREYLNALRPDYLVSVAFYGSPVPVITVSDGVMRLKAVQFAGKRFEGAGTVSELLGVAQTRNPLPLSKAKGK